MSMTRSLRRCLNAISVEENLQNSFLNIYDRTKLKNLIWQSCAHTNRCRNSPLLWREIFIRMPLKKGERAGKELLHYGSPNKYKCNLIVKVQCFFHWPCRMGRLSHSTVFKKISTVFNGFQPFSIVSNSFQQFSTVLHPCTTRESVFHVCGIFFFGKSFF